MAAHFSFEFSGKFSGIAQAAINCQFTGNSNEKCDCGSTFTLNTLHSPAKSPKLIIRHRGHCKIPLSHLAYPFRMLFSLFISGKHKIMRCVEAWSKLINYANWKAGKDQIVK